jgi:hypothetical protein
MASKEETMRLIPYIYAASTGALLTAAFILTPKIDKLITELDRTCFVGVPEKPDGNGYHLVWIKHEKRKK